MWIEQTYIHQLTTTIVLITKHWCQFCNSATNNVLDDSRINFPVFGAAIQIVSFGHGWYCSEQWMLLNLKENFKT